MPVERATFDNDLAAVEAGAAIGTVNWVDSYVDCRIVVDLWFSPLVAWRMNGLHYSHLCCNFGWRTRIAHCSGCCYSSPPFFRYRTRCCKSCMCRTSTGLAGD